MYKRYRDEWMKLLPNKFYIQGMEVLLTDEVHKQKPQSKWLYVSHNHPYISSSKKMWHLPYMPLLLK